MKWLSWYFNRVRKMSLVEIFHRVIELFLIYYDRLFFKYFNRKRHFSFIHTENLLLDHDVCVPYDIERAEISFNCLLDEESFNKLRFMFFKNIDYREGNPYGDFRAFWELNRFNSVFDSVESEQDNYNSFRKYFLSWCADNKPLHGANYISVMECAIRCLNLTYFISRHSRTIAGDYALLSALCGFVSDNYRIIKHRLSLHSSKGNHTLYEFAGLLCLSILMNNRKQIKNYAGIFFNHFLEQTNPDGGGVEQATGYHYTNLQLAIYVSSICSNYITIPVTFSQRLTSCREFISNFFIGERLIRFGDWDNGILFRNRINATLPVTKYHTLSIFDSSGYICSSFKRSRLIFKYGKLGMKPLYGHGHCNPLSVSLILDGTQITCDDSTYLYSSEQKRKFFRSSESKNMPRLTSGENIIQSNSFSWDRDYNSSFKLLSSSQDVNVFQGTTDVFSCEIKRLIFHGDSFFIFIDVSKSKFLETSWYLQSESQGSISIQTFSFSQDKLKPIESKCDFDEYSPRYFELDMSRRYKLNSKYGNIVTVISCRNNKLLQSEVFDLIYSMRSFFYE